MYMNFLTDSLLLKASVYSKLLASSLSKLRFTPLCCGNLTCPFQVVPSQHGVCSLGLSFQRLPVNTTQGNLHILLLESSEHCQPESIYPLIDKETEAQRSISVCLDHQENME